MAGHHRHACEMLFKRCFTGGQMMAWLLWYLDPLAPKKKKKRHCHSWTPRKKLSDASI